jgi:hypothetical protein
MPRLDIGVARVFVDGEPKHWAKVPFEVPIALAEPMWMSQAHHRALVLRVTKDREVIDLVDLTHHYMLDHAELCNDHVEAQAWLDDAESVALLHLLRHDGTVADAIVDLVRGKFVRIGASSKPEGPSCSGDWGLTFESPEVVGFFDAQRRRVGRALVSFDGKTVARLDGDFPDAPLPANARDAALAIDAERRLILRVSPTEACAGVMHVVAAKTAEGASVGAPRCVALCGAAEKIGVAS